MYGGNCDQPRISDRFICLLTKRFFRITWILLDELKDFGIFENDFLLLMIDISPDIQILHPEG
jgi:hypothetical protein